ncbi:IclR family transcriptional regulator [Pseudonocardia xinjiangensis]|uniref:IclR family transcriptional regulator n=1 Tax=Pseudonocardia xinjiangensis TaxID=75289 RepID=UPI003D8D6F78
MPSGPSSADRVLELLALLHARGRLRVRDAALALDIAPSTAHRLLTTLVRHGFARRDVRHEYFPGTSATPAGGEPVDLAVVARPHLEALAAEVGETVHLMVLEGASARFVAVVEGGPARRVAPRVGLLMPAHLTSGGKALLAELTAEELRELYPRGLPLTPDAAGPAAGVLRRELAAIRRRGYARNVEETERGVSAVGACVREGRHRAVAAIVIAAPSSRARGRSLDRLSGPLLVTAAAVTAQLATRGRRHAAGSGTKGFRSTE